MTGWTRRSLYRFSKAMAHPMAIAFGLFFCFYFAQRDRNAASQHVTTDLLRLASEFGTFPFAKED